MQQITVRWLDHFDVDSTWSEPTSPADLVPIEVESCGYVVSENEVCLQLAGDRPISEGDDKYGRLAVILKCAITYRSDKA